MTPLTSNSNHTTSLDSHVSSSNDHEVDNDNNNNNNELPVKGIAQLINTTVAQEVEKSTVFDVKAQNDILKFHSSELTLGRVLGRGGFCVVYELDAIELLLGDDNDSNDYNDNDTESDDNKSQISRTSSLASLACIGRNRLRRKKATSNTLTTFVFDNDDDFIETRKSMSKTVTKTRKAKYVVKKVDPKLVHRDNKTFIKGTIDLILEAKFLSSLQHPNIICIKAMTISAATHAHDNVDDYFIIVDRMFTILSKRLNDWMQRYRATKGMTGFITRGKKRANDLLIERLIVAKNITSAMSYIHSKNIVYRDLKPDNVGFDKEGNVKLFDFGLAKELTEDRKTIDRDGYYNMTCMTGGIRYMAPEVGLNKPYNNKVDVYSWSMVFWYILALEPPFGLYTNNMFVDRVFQKKYRPAINDKWPIEYGILLKQCWNHKINVRPSFDEIHSILQDEIQKIIETNHTTTTTTTTTTLQEEKSISKNMEIKISTVKSSKVHVNEVSSLDDVIGWNDEVIKK